MRDEPFGKVFKSVARLCGLDPARMSTELAESLAGWIEQRVTQAWEAFPWPELCPVEERYYAPAHDSGQTYALNDIVRVTTNGATAYYTLLNAGSQAAAPGTNEAVWQTTAPARFIDLDQAEAFGVKDIAPMGEVLGVWRDDPRKVRGPREVAFTLSGDQICLDPHAPASVFVRFRKRPPQFTSTPWDANATYAPGDVVFYGGECYAAGIVVTQPFITVSGNGWILGISPNGIYRPNGMTTVWDGHAEPSLVYQAEASNWVLYQNNIGQWQFGVLLVPEMDPDHIDEPTIVKPTQNTASFDSGLMTWRQILGGDPNSSRTPYVAEVTAPLYQQGSPTVVLTNATANPAADATSWTRVRVPHVLANFVRRSARADFLADDGQDDKSFAQERRAQEWLEEQFIAVTVTQRQTAKYTAHR